MQRLIQGHERAIVLGQEELGRDPVTSYSRAKGLHSKLDDPDERRIEDGSILALQQAQHSNLVGERDGDMLTYCFA